MEEPTKPCYNCGQINYDWYWLETPTESGQEIEIYYCKNCGSEA